MPNASRGMWNVVLQPHQWVTLHEHEDPFNDPAYYSHHINFHLEADPTNTANVQIEIHESENGANWIRSARGRGVLVPGGKLDLNSYHVYRWVRVVLYSPGSGIVRGTWVVPEAQTLPGGVISPPDVEVAGDPTVTVAFQDPGPGQQKPCVYQYTFTATLDWDAYLWCWEDQPTALICGPWFPDPGGGGWCMWFYPPLDLYVRDVNADEVIYSGNLVGTDLSLNRDAYPNCVDDGVGPPEIITGTYTEENSFYVWYNETNDCAPEVEPTVKSVTITNTGTCNLIVNGTVLGPGEVCTINDFLYAGYGSGDMSAWLGGTPVPVIS